MSEQQSEREQIAREVGERIHMLMWRRKVSQGDLGKTIGVGQSTAGKKVRGETPITIVELVQIARLLEVEPGDLLSDRYTTTDSNREPAVMEPAPVVDLAARRRRTA